MNLFDRVVELTVGETDITGLDIAFEIEKDESPEPNPCHVDIYNLGPENRRILSRYDRVPVVLKAGYKDSVGIIFQGDMVRCNHLNERASWKTTLAIGDGVKAIQEARCTKALKEGTPLHVVVMELIKAINLPTANISPYVGKVSGSLNRSVSLLGNPIGEVNRILAAFKMRLFIHNNVVHIRLRHQPLQKEAINLSASSGLIASPEVDKQKKVIVKALLIADFQPGRLVHLDTEVFKNFVVVEKVRFSGANFGDAWEAEMECEVY